MIFTAKNIFYILVFAFTALGFSQKNTIAIMGKLVEKGTAEVLPFATISVHDKASNEIVNGTTSDYNGNFNIEVKQHGFYLSINFMGYKTQKITDFNIINNQVNLGVVELLQDSQALEAIELTGEVSKTIFKLDKRVFNVGKDISSTGASALEVLNNVPSVNVNIEGEISLRGSGGVQVLINGKPSVLADEASGALGTITADMIESIEVITNPSAKYDASGTSGILNIILKKEEKRGWNGSITANTGFPENHSLGASLNRRTEKFNLFTQFGVGYRSLPRENESKSENLTSNEITTSEGTEYRNEGFANITLGTDYHLNDYNVFTLSGNFAYELEDQPSDTYFNLSRNDTLLSSWTRIEETEATNPKWQYDFNWKKTFKNNEEHTFQLSALGRFFGKDLSSRFNDITTAGDDVDDEQEATTSFQQADYTFKADYVNPVSKTVTIETGAQYVINDVGNEYVVLTLVGDDFVNDPDFTNDFTWNQKVLGAYLTTAYENDVWGVMGGLRVENTDLTTYLSNTTDESNSANPDEFNTQNFTNFFPSFHSSYKIMDDLSIQAGYSKRIFRPRLWDLNPFSSIRNNFNIRAGNPDLQPEFTDSYELTSIYKIGKASLSSSLYHRFTTEVVERINIFEDNITTSIPENIGTNASYGFETNGKYNPAKWLTFTGDFNYNYFDRKGSYEDQTFDFVGNKWSTRLSSKIGLPADVDVEVEGNFQSGFKTVQGEQSGFAFMNLGFRKKILKGKVVVNFGVRDVFASRIQETFSSQTNEFENYNFSQRGRFFTFGVSYGFGKGEAMTYSGRRRR